MAELKQLKEASASDRNRSSLPVHIFNPNGGFESPGALPRRFFAKFLFDSQTVLAGTASRIEVFDRTGGLRSSLDCGGTCDFVTASPDGKQVAAIIQNKFIALYDLATQSFLTNLQGKLPGISSAVYSPNGHHLLLFNEDHAEILDLRSGESLGVLSLKAYGKAGPIGMADFLSDDQVVLFAGQMNQLLWTFNSHPAQLSSISINTSHWPKAIRLYLEMVQFGFGNSMKLSMPIAMDARPKIHPRHLP